VTIAGAETVGSAQYFRNLGLPENTRSVDEQTRRGLLHPDDEGRVMREIVNAAQTGADFVETEYRIVRASDGETRWVLARIKPECDADGRLVRLVGAHLDITEAKTAALRLQETVRLNEGIVDSSPDCIKILDLDGTLRFASQRGLQTMEGGDVTNVLGRPWQDLWPEDVRPTVERALALARAGEGTRFDAGCVTLRGNPMWLDVVVTPLKNEAGEVTELLSITRDVTELRQQAERIRWAAEHDALTGLPNRNYFDEQLETVLAGAGSGAEQVGLLALDVDNFKQVNDAFGHDAGDALLKELSRRVRELLQEGDFAARLGGDEFAIVLRHVERGRDVLEIGQAVNAAMKQPVAHQGCILDCRVSIGAAIFPEHGEARDEFLKSADTALYAAKIGGRNAVLLFEPSQRADLDRRTAMIGMAKSALDLDNIVPFYQPKVCLRTGAIDGFEALLRWRDSSGAIRPPAELEAAFEDLELAHEISERMQDRILEDLSGWLDRSLDCGHVAINAAAAEFSRNDFAPRLLDKLGAAGVPASRLQVEVTETVFLGRGAEHVREALIALKDKGICIALDDFGTGYASLSHLKNFPVDIIKIDKSFITDLGQNSGDTAIVCALLGLAADLRMAIVAEGIETAGQAEFLRARNCDIGQGYYFGKPVGADRVPALIGSR
jgi:diguanylate cyclase (GGDEF)-like protein/PAS domain S-box-containing protein